MNRWPNVNWKYSVSCRSRLCRPSTHNSTRPVNLHYFNIGGDFFSENKSRVYCPKGNHFIIISYTDVYQKIFIDRISGAPYQVSGELFGQEDISWNNSLLLVWNRWICNIIKLNIIPFITYRRPTQGFVIFQSIIWTFGKNDCIGHWLSTSWVWR